MRDDQLTRVHDLAWSPFKGMGRKPSNSGTDTLDYPTRGLGVIKGDMTGMATEVQASGR